MRVVVITPTTGIPELAQAIQSVAKQGDGVEHWVVVDGTQYAEKAIKVVLDNQHPQLKLIILPENTGCPNNYFKELDANFYGHRIYAGVLNFINADYVLFLDEDNWFEPNHVSTMVEGIQNYNLDWIYSLRKIVDKSGNFLCEDNCDSLGIYPNQNRITFVDMNCYCFKTEFALKLAPTLYRADYNTDRQVFKQALALSTRYDNFSSTGRYTVNYRANRDENKEWFLNGNIKMHDIYKKFPWSIE